MHDWRMLAIITKRSGESGSPCLSLLSQWMVCPGTPLKRTCEVVVERIILIQLHHFCPKPLYWSSFITSPCSTISKAFSKSSFKRIISSFDFWQEFRYSCAQARQSWIVLVLMNPYWFLWTISLITICSQMAKSFVIIFRVQLRSEIGLNSFTDSALSILGMRAMK